MAAKYYQKILQKPFIGNELREQEKNIKQQYVRNLIFFARQKKTKRCEYMRERYRKLLEEGKDKKRQYVRERYRNLSKML